MRCRGGRSLLPSGHNPILNPEAVMPAIKLHLEQAEYEPVERLATALGVSPEAVLYAGLNRLMLEARRPGLREEVAQLWEAHRDNLPLWSDSACSVHAYEGKPDDEPHRSLYI
jgi:hypothetical protein